VFPLFQAAHFGHATAVRVLLAGGADANQIAQSGRGNGRFPLLMAANDGHIAAVEELLARGADVNQVNLQTGAFPLLRAAKKGHSACVDLLLACGARPNQSNLQDGDCPLLLAAKKGHAECTRALVDQGAEYHGLQTDLYPVLIAAINGYSDAGIVRRAVQEDGLALRFVPASLTEDKELVISAVTQRGDALQYASAALKDDPEVVRRALQQDKGALRFAGENLVQRPDLLMEAGLLWASWLAAPDSSSNQPLVVMSVRFALHRKASAASTYLQVHLTQHRFLKKFRYYNPNAFNKGFCKVLDDGNIDWGAATAKDWKCRGKLDGPAQCDRPMKCAGQDHQCTNCQGMRAECTRPCNNSCWRYSFAWHQKMAIESKGFMLQVVEEGMLGAGQEIEAEMAENIGLKVFKIEVSSKFNPNVDEHDAVAVNHLANSVEVDEQR